MLSSSILMEATQQHLPALRSSEASGTCSTALQQLPVMQPCCALVYQSSMCVQVAWTVSERLCASICPARAFNNCVGSCRILLGQQRGNTCLASTCVVSMPNASAGPQSPDISRSISIGHDNCNLCQLYASPLVAMDRSAPVVSKDSFPKPSH